MRKIISATLAVAMLGAVTGSALAQGSGTGGTGGTGGGVNEPNPKKEQMPGLDTRHPNERSQ